MKQKSETAGRMKSVNGLAGILALVSLVMTSPQSADAFRRSPVGATLERGDLRVEIERNEAGPIVYWKGCRIFHGSSLTIRSENYQTRYLDPARIKPNDPAMTGRRLDDVEGFEIRAESAEYGIVLVYRVTLTDDHTLLVDTMVDSTKVAEPYLEFGPLIMSHEPTAGRVMHRAGGKEEGLFVLPLKPSPHEKRFLKLGDPARMEIYSRAGRVTVTTEGDLAGLGIVDARSSQYAHSGYQRAFMLYRRFLVEKGRHHYRVRITFEDYDRAPEPTAALLAAAGMVAPDGEVATGADGGPIVIPQPRRARWTGESISLRRARVWVPGSLTDAMRARLADMPIPGELETRVSDRLPDHTVVVGRSDRIDVPALDLPPQSMESRAREQASRLVISRKGAVLRAASDEGLWYGWLTVVQLAENSRGESLPAGDVVDWPAIEFRGYHLTPRNAWPNLDYVTALIRAIGKAKFNHLCIQFAGDVELESHPAGVRDNSWTRDEVREMIRAGEAAGLTVFPEIKAIGHAQWAHGGGPRGRPLKFYPELTDWFSPDGASFNPASREAMAMLKSCIDEMVDLFDSPPYFHISGDEAHNWATGEAVRDKDPARLLADWIIDLHEHVRSHGCETIMWGDMFLPPEEYPDYTAAHAVRGTERALQWLPREIIIADWQYGDNETFPSARMFQREGFRVIGCPWNDRAGIRNWGRQLADMDATGILGTSWFQILSSFPGIAATAEAGWNPARAARASERRNGAARLVTWVGERAEGPPLDVEKSRFVSLKKFFNRSLSDAHVGDGEGWLDHGPSQDLSAFPTGKVEFAGVPFHVRKSAPNAVVLRSTLPPLDEEPARVGPIDVGRAARRLHFLQGVGFSPDGDAQVMTARIRYDDGSEMNVPIRNERETDYWLPVQKLVPHHPRPPAAVRTAWRGMTRNDALAAVYLLSIDCDPEKVVESVELIGEPTIAAPFVIALTVEQP